VLRRMGSADAVAVWRHSGWGDVVGWINRRVPDCDPTVAAIHAVRNAPRAVEDVDYARRLAGYVVRVAKHSRWEPSAHDRLDELTWDPPEPSRTYRRTESLVEEAASLLTAVGIHVNETVRGILAPSIDIAVDWWDALATRTGLVGDELVAAARLPRQTTGGWRLSAQFDGPAARPLVALLVGGDQPGRQAREASGVEAGLLYWSLQVRLANSLGDQLPVPPTAIVRAWATNIAWIQRTVSPANPGPGLGPDHRRLSVA
jgi:hypothetical protein